MNWAEYFKSARISAPITRTGAREYYIETFTAEHEGFSGFILCHSNALQMYIDMKYFLPPDLLSNVMAEQTDCFVLISLKLETLIFSRVSLHTCAVSYNCVHGICTSHILGFYTVALYSIFNGSQCKMKEDWNFEIYAVV